MPIVGPERTSGGTALRVVSLGSGYGWCDVPGRDHGGSDRASTVARLSPRPYAAPAMLNAFADENATFEMKR